MRYPEPGSEPREGLAGAVVDLLIGPTRRVGADQYAQIVALPQEGHLHGRGGAEGLQDFDKALMVARIGEHGTASRHRHLSRMPQGDGNAFVVLFRLEIHWRGDDVKLPVGSD